MSIVSDQFYLTGIKTHDVEKFKIASQLFPIDRNLVLAPAYYYFLHHEINDKTIIYINKGIEYDPNAADLLQVQMQYSFLLGKTDDALRAFNRLALIAPNSKIVKILSKGN